ncbi:MAG: hypothetical protein ACOYXC_19430 [Candidatus Rifleibacteriota bacterium]
MKLRAGAIFTCLLMCLSMFLSAAPKPYDITGTWVFGPNGEKWTFKKLSPDRYEAHEYGFANAKGKVLLVGRQFTLNFEFPGGSGKYQGSLSLDGKTIDAIRLPDKTRFKFNWISKETVVSQTLSSPPFPEEKKSSKLKFHDSTYVGKWVFGPGGEYWIFSLKPDGTYEAQEYGFAGAKGTASFMNKSFRLDFNFAGGSGFFEGTIADDKNSISAVRRPDNTSFVFRRDSLLPGTAKEPPQDDPVTEAGHSSFSLTGDWQFGPGGEYWTFTPNGNGTWQAQEHGFANAKGVAKVSGDEFRLDFTFSNGSGYFLGKIAADGYSISTTRYHDGAKFLFRRISINEDKPSDFSSPSPKPPLGKSELSLAGKWFFGPGGEYWIFSKNPDGSWNAQEHGFANARGVAKLSGKEFRLDFTFANGSGYFLGTMSADGKSIAATRYYDGTKFTFRKAD